MLVKRLKTGIKFPWIATDWLDQVVILFCYEGCWIEKLHLYEMGCLKITTLRVAWDLATQKQGVRLLEQLRPNSQIVAPWKSFVNCTGLFAKDPNQTWYAFAPVWKLYFAWIAIDCKSNWSLWKNSVPAFKSMIQSRFGVLTSEIALLSLQSQQSLQILENYWSLRLFKDLQNNKSLPNLLSLPKPTDSSNQSIQLRTLWFSPGLKKKHSCVCFMYIF